MQGTFHILTFGCQMNLNDSAWLHRALTVSGMHEAPIELADFILLNTCSVRDKPEQRVYTALKRIEWLTRNNPRAFVGIAGCVAQQIGENFFPRFPQVRLVAGADGMSRIPDAVEELFRFPEKRFCFTHFEKKYLERPNRILDSCPHGQIPISPIAYVNIMQGCDNFCTYCIVPFTRGRQKSRNPQDIIQECRDLLSRGVREITLLGQNVNAFGKDRLTQGESDHSFSDLLRLTAQQCRRHSPSVRLRYVTPHPKDFTDEDIELFAELSDTLCPRLHLPMQSGSNPILKRMGRRYTMQTFLNLIEKLRKARPDLALSTDLIVGFPGETEEQFQETLDAVREIGFMSSFSFCYSDRPGTAASRMTDKIDPEIQGERLTRLQELQEELSNRWLQGRIGLETELLLEGLSRKQSDDPRLESWKGRDPWGDVVNIALPQHIGRTGSLIRVHIQEAKKHSLIAVPADRADA
ncbi:MAG: tRNA (N6-isopentenyl adenosine(37)-C2)-methylthiotransferase MiaB [Desulfovibrionaceae bacterium]|nr:tRNA (N6-isopentenyl adenosine(37)-C2)-methylthiotransferase MiaB [Desulfovibrionaceae bacterium]